MNNKSEQIKHGSRWKGNGVGRSALHCWIRRVYGLADHCILNPKHKSNKFEWANISHKYKRSINDFMQLCPSCHRKYDFTDLQRRKISASMLGNRRSIKPILQLSKSGKVIKKWEAIQDVENSTEILCTSIANVLSGRSKTAGGYFWRYIQ